MGISRFTTSEIDEAVGYALNASRRHGIDKDKVFIVHGHDDLAKNEMADFIRKIGLKPIVLHEQASSSMTIIEKIEDYSNVGFGIVLYTPCDLGISKKEKDSLRPRARQNVVFEHGFLIGKLGRQYVAPFKKGTVDVPNDISGMVYTDMDDNGVWKEKLITEMNSVGYDVELK